jgi:hypothetical protein
MAIVESITTTRVNTSKLFLNELNNSKIQDCLTTYNTTGQDYTGNMIISSDNLTMVLNRSFDTMNSWVSYRNVIGSIFQDIVEDQIDRSINYELTFINTPGNITLTETISLIGIGNPTNANYVASFCDYDSISSSGNVITVTSNFPTPGSDEFSMRAYTNLTSIIAALPANSFTYSHTISAG